MNYRWELRKGSRKEICPACGQRRFVPYVSAADGKTMAGAAYGRCDREQNCGYQCYPNGVETDKNVTIKVPEPKEPIRFRRDVVRTDCNTNLFVYACDLVGYEKAKRAWSMYHIGAWGSATIFWQISKGMEVRSAKAILYRTDGHRVKDRAVPVWWLHKCKQTDDWFKGEELQQCFFGEHLLAHIEHKEKEVYIVESEKTAALMSVIDDTKLWLACGGSQNLKNDQKNKVLEGREVVLCPDNGQYDHWRLIAHKNGWEITSVMEHKQPFEGADILDLKEMEIKTKRI